MKVLLPPNRTPDQIRAQLDQDRDALQASVEGLRDSFSMARFWDDGVTLAKANAVPYTLALDRTVRAKPLAMALTGVGLAWLMLGNRGQHKPASDPAPLAGTRFEAEQRWEDEGGPVRELPLTETAWIEQADGLRLRAAHLIARIAAAETNKSAPAAALQKHRSEVEAALVKDIRRVMGQALDHLSGPARKAEIGAREQKYLAHLAQIATGPGILRARPLTVGFALAAAGAALGAILPQSLLEQQVISAPRQRLAQAVQSVLTDERQRFAATLDQLALALTQSIIVPPHPAAPATDTA